MAKILVVDDENNLAIMLQKVLTISGYEVEIAETGYDALDKVKKTSFDICLLDIKLPDINGVEVFIKMKEISPRIKVVMMTGFAVDDLIDMALKEGAYACIHKPFNIEELLEKVTTVIASKRRVIIIADGAEKIRKEIRDFFESKKHVVYEAKNGTEIIAYVKRQRCDVMLLDYELPDKNYLDVFKEAKAIDSKIVVILMLDEPLESLYTKALSAGFYGWMEKPIDTDRLLTIIEEALKDG